MVDASESSRPQIFWNSLLFTALRMAMGLLWTILAVEVWSPGFVSHLHRYHETVFRSQPGLLMPWFGIWAGILSIAPDLFVNITRFFVTLIAIFLLIGFARKITYIVGIIFCIPLWALMEGFSPQHALGSFVLSAALIYILLLSALILVEKLDVPLTCNIDSHIERKWPSWRRISRLSANQHRQTIVTLGLEHRLFLLLSAVIFAFLISGSANSLNLGHPVSLSPLKIGSSAPVQTAHNALLPPLLGAGDNVEVHIEASHRTVEISSGVYYQAWTYNGTAPAPTIHVRQGQTVHVTFTNNNSMPHSIDFHSAMIAPDYAFASAYYGETVEFSFKAKVPGAFVYHCGTPPVLLHQGNGMYGAVIVDPIKPLPPADVSYVLVQSEWYTQLVSGTTMMGDYEKMATNKPDLVTFNGAAFQYQDHPLPVKAGRRARI